MSRMVQVPYAGTDELVDVDLPTWPERHVWWPLAWQMAEWERHLLWVTAYRYRPIPVLSSAARWLVTHTPWWGGPGISRPEIHRRWGGR